MQLLPHAAEPEWHRAFVRENLHLAWDVVQLTVEPHRPTRFRAGQYMNLRLDASEWRPFSIASSPSRPERLEFCIRRVGGGTVSPLVAGVRPGEEVEFQGPMGEFFLREQDGRRLFVATGTGIAPLRSMILHLLESGDPRPILLVFGNHGPEDLLYLDEFRNLETRYPRFRFVPCLSRPGGWNGRTGRVTDVLPEVLEDPPGWSAYICGRDEMILDATRLLVGLGLPAERCYREPWPEESGYAR